MILVPYVPTPYEVIKVMLEIAEVKPGELVFDLGCGDGRVLITAVKEFGANAVGIELRRDLVEKCLKNVLAEGLEDRILIIEGDFFKVNISPADVVTLYLLTSVNEKLRPKLERELKRGARVVSHDFEVMGWKPIAVKDVNDGYRNHKVYLYKV